MKYFYDEFNLQKTHSLHGFILRIYRIFFEVFTEMCNVEIVAGCEANFTSVLREFFTCELHEDFISWMRAATHIDTNS